MGHSHSKSHPPSPTHGNASKHDEYSAAPPPAYPGPAATFYDQKPGVAPAALGVLERHGSVSDDALDMLRRYDVVVLVDDSGSMTGHQDRSWKEARDALSTLADKAGRYDTNGIDVCFLNSDKSKKGMRDAKNVLALFDQVKPSGGTPIGQRLEHLLSEALDELEDAKAKGKLKELKPVSIIVITDGEPTDDPESVIVAAAKRLDEGKFSLSQIGIQFVQVGNDPKATAFLRELDDSLTHTYHIRDIVDTTSSTALGGALSADSLIKVLLGGINRRVDKKSHVAT